MTELVKRSCRPYNKDESALTAAQVAAYLQKIDGWSHDPSQETISRVFKFENYYQTMAFVNALAWIAHREDHHPDIEVGYKTCKVTFTTHSVNGLTENDFICAAKLNQLLGDRS